jgi:hypothetical protein
MKEEIAMAAETLEVRLSVQAEGPEVTATLEFANVGQGKAPLWGPLACLNGRLDNNLFEVLCDGVRIPFRGPLAKRQAPRPDEFLFVEPGESLVSTVRLDGFYTFPPGGGEYTAAYLAYNPDPESGAVSLLRSNAVTFQL